MIEPVVRPGSRAAERLRGELVVWLTTVTATGQPQTSPVWFLWVDDEILVYSRADTPRPRNIRANPRVAATFDSDGDGGGVVSIEGEAHISRERALPSDVPPAYVEKYAAKLAANGWTMATMLADYPVEIRIRPTRIRAW